MPRSTIPERQPIGDSLSAAVIRMGAAELMVTAVPAGTEAIYQGVMIVRYGVRYLGKPHLSVVPGLVALDYGDMLTAEDAWDFLFRHSNLHPRAEVFGYRNDGRDEMITVKNLDLALPVEVLVYENEKAVTPVARPTAIIADDAQRAAIAPRLLEYLPCFATVAAWQAATGNG